MVKPYHPMPPSPEGEPMTTLATRIPKALHRELRLYCVERGITAQEVVAAALRERLAADRKASRGSKSEP
jgi:hypothetical protein